MTASPSLFDACPRVPLQHLQHPVLLQAGVSVALLRLDQTDAVVSGNKWYKLKYNLEWACEQGFRRVLSFGGAYSNHIHALADAGRAMGLETIGMIRGSRLMPLILRCGMLRSGGCSFILSVGMNIVGDMTGLILRSSLSDFPMPA